MLGMCMQVPITDANSEVNSGKENIRVADNQANVEVKSDPEFEGDIKQEQDKLREEEQEIAQKKLDEKRKKYKKLAKSTYLSKEWKIHRKLLNLLNEMIRPLTTTSNKCSGGNARVKAVSKALNEYVRINKKEIFQSETKEQQLNNLYNEMKQKNKEFAKLRPTPFDLKNLMKKEKEVKHFFEQLKSYNTKTVGLTSDVGLLFTSGNGLSVGFAKDACGNRSPVVLGRDTELGGTGPIIHFGVGFNSFQLNKRSLNELHLSSKDREGIYTVKGALVLGGGGSFQPKVKGIEVGVGLGVCYVQNKISGWALPLRFCTDLHAFAENLLLAESGRLPDSLQNMIENATTHEDFKAIKKEIERLGT